MNTSDLDQAEPLLQPQEDDVECRSEKQAMERETRSVDRRQGIHNFNQLKSVDIMKSALKIITSNAKLMFLMMFSIIPLFVFMVFYEIKLQKAIVSATNVIRLPYRIINVSLVSLGNGSHSVTTTHHTRIPEIDDDNITVKFLFDVLQLCLLFLVVYPLLELLSMITVIQIASKVYAEEKTATLKEVFDRNINLKGVLINCFLVHLLSSLTFLGLIWIVVHHLSFTSNPANWYYYDFQQLIVSYGLYILSLGIHSMCFIALLYKYLGWSAFWNMSMVISVLEKETGLDAFGMTDYYGKHCKSTGFQLMLGFVGMNIVLRLACFCVNNGLSNLSVVGGVTSVVIGLVCLGNLVKWVAFVLYYFDCKQQTMEKKNDLETGKAVNVA